MGSEDLRNIPVVSLHASHSGLARSTALLHGTLIHTLLVVYRRTRMV